MSHPSKRKGTDFERQLVRDAQGAGLPCYRCWGSDGRSHGYSKDTDVVIGDRIKLQAKRKAKLPTWLGLSDDVDGVVLREDRGKTFVVVRWDDYLQLLKCSPAQEAA